jgi:hypothetical protein
MYSLRESIRSLRIRLEDPSSRVVILALILTESIVKNCGHFAHLEIGTESFLHQFELLYKVSFRFFSIVLFTL